MTDANIVPLAGSRKRGKKKTPTIEPVGTGSFQDPFADRDATTLDRVLAEAGIELRWNIRAASIEFREPTTGRKMSDWRAVDDLMMARTADDIARQYYCTSYRGPVRLRYGRDRWTDGVNAICDKHRVDPFKEYLEGLPRWPTKQTSIIEQILPGLFGAKDDELSRWAGRYLFLGAVERTYEPGCKLDEIPVLIGPQGCGKSSFLKAIVPREMPQLFGDGLRFDARPENQVDAILGRLIVEISEMAGRSRSDIETTKSFISRQDDGKRTATICTSYRAITAPIRDGRNDQQCERPAQRCQRQSAVRRYRVGTRGKSLCRVVYGQYQGWVLGRGDAPLPQEARIRPTAARSHAHASRACGAPPRPRRTYRGCHRKPAACRAHAIRGRRATTREP